VSRHFAEGAAPACCRAVSELIAEILESDEGLEWAQSVQWRPDWRGGVLDVTLGG
jgi:hypothetical protein